MEKYKYKVSKDDRINVWKYDSFNLEKFYSEPTVFENKDHYYNIGVTAKNMEEIAEIIYPVREKFLEQNILEKVEYSKREYNNLYYPWENTRVEFSGFNHYPTIRSLNFQSYINVEEDCECPFELKVTGGIKIWVNGELQLQYGEYKRNCGITKIISLKLQKGENEIVVYTNDLSERDIFYFFEMKYIGDTPLECYVFIENVDSFENSVKCLKSMYFINDECEQNNCRIGFEPDIIPEGFTFNLKSTEMNKVNSYVVTNDDKENGYISISNYFDNQNLGGHKVKVICEVDNVKLERELYVLVYAKENENLMPKETLKERKEQAIEYLYKYKSGFITRVLPTLEKGLRLNADEEKFFYEVLKTIDDRLDCADFRLPIILLIKTKYGHLLDEKLLVEIKRVTLNFRYWIDELGSDVMWFFSENHAFLFHVSQYLSGDIYKDEKFISGYSSDEQYKIGLERLNKWFDEFLAVGYDEWNSTTYLPVDFIGFFVLHEIATDAEIVKKVKMALDISFEIIASNVHRKIYATSYGRTYEKQLKSAKLAELSMISWVAFGKGSPNNRDHATALFAISSYEPKDYSQLLDLENKAITVERLQGRNNVYTYMHKREEYALASAVKYSPFEDGMQQHVVNVVLGDKDRNLISWINHPGERLYSGEYRPSYWAGNGTLPLVEQYKNLCLISYDIDENKDVHYIHAYMPLNALDEYKVVGKWFFGRVDNAYTGIYFENGFEIVRHGANTNKEIISHGLQNIAIIKCGSMVEHNNFENFVEKCLSSKLKIVDSKNFSYDDFEYGNCKIEPLKNLIVNDKELKRDAKKEGIVSIE